MSLAQLHLLFSCRKNISASYSSFNFEKSNQYTVGFFFFTLITKENDTYGLYLMVWSGWYSDKIKAKLPSYPLAKTEQLVWSGKRWDSDSLLSLKVSYIPALCANL